MSTKRRRSLPSPLRLTVASTVRSNMLVQIGDMVGIALTDYSAVDGKATLDFDGVYAISASGYTGSAGALAVGDALYYTAADTAPNGPVNKRNSGKPIGYALEPVGSGLSQEILVRLTGR